MTRQECYRCSTDRIDRSYYDIHFDDGSIERRCLCVRCVARLDDRPNQITAID